MHGDGVFTFDDGRRYEGQYVKGEKGGIGLFTWADGRTYEGGFEAGRQHGRGIFRVPGRPDTRGRWERGALVGTWDASGVCSSAASSSESGHGSISGFGSAKVVEGMAETYSENSMAETKSTMRCRGSSWRRPSPTESSSDEASVEEVGGHFSVLGSAPEAVAMRPSDEIL